MEMFKAVCKLGLEGIVSKKLDDIGVWWISRPRSLFRIYDGRILR